MILREIPSTTTLWGSAVIFLGVAIAEWYNQARYKAPVAIKNKD
jgi:hypothetical protein